MQALHVRRARARRRRTLGLFFIAFAITTAELCWWVTFNVRAAHASQAADAQVLKRDCALAQVLVDAHSGVDWQTLFPRLQLDESSQTVVPRSGEALAAARAHGAHVRMFLAEGAFFLLMVALGGGLVFRTMRLEVGVVRQQANFLNAITHELKSPLTAMRLYIETLQRRQVDPETLARYVTTLRGECDRLETLVGHVLLLAHIDGPDGGAQALAGAGAQGIDIAPLCATLVAEAAEALPEHAHAPIWQPPQGPVWAQVDVASFRTIAQNLLSNAIKYGGNARPAEVTCERAAGAVRLRVRDYGMGLAASEQGRVFGAFYRVGDEMVRQHPGSGLGLYLVRALARAHRGEVRLHSAGLGHGCEVIVTLCAAAAPNLSEVAA